MDVPTLEREALLLRDFDLVIACDEVGRGAIAGPVTVGAAVIDRSHLSGSIPAGLRDSKLIAEKRRAGVAELAREWVNASAIGSATPAEIDDIGIIGALGVAAVRALDELADAGIPVGRAAILLDGNHDYISARASGRLTVIPIVKADRDCASAAAASVLAKVDRDALMVGLDAEDPRYGWAKNKGYASTVHRAAIIDHGLSEHHRASWAIGPAPVPALF